MKQKTIHIENLSIGYLGRPMLKLWPIVSMPALTVAN